MLVLVTFLFLVSMAINVVLVWYIRKMIQEVAPLHQRTVAMRDTMEEFVDYATQVHELPLYYGDQTIKDFVENVKTVTQEVEDYKNSFIFESEGEEFGETDAQE